MRKAVIVFLICSLIILSAGCALLPQKPAEALPGEDTTSTQPTPQSPQASPATQESVVDDVIEQVVATKYVPAEPEPVNVSNETEEVVLKTSGSLKLQSNLAMCPHLVQRFDCNRYDIRSCKFKTLVGQNDFYPDIISCRDGYEYRKEDPRHKYCYIQECRPLEENNIVDGYGGPVIYAEYIYSEEKTATGIMTHYALFSCGETWQESKTSADCRFYLSKLNTV
jgi:hypothetical protein